MNLQFKTNFQNNNSMAQEISNENIKVDFRYFISSALQNKITWEALDHFLNDLTPTLATSKQVIKVLLKELQKLHFELQEIQTEKTDNEVRVLECVSGNKADLSENFKDNHSLVIDQDFSIPNQDIQTENDSDQSNSDEVKISKPGKDRIEIINENGHCLPYRRTVSAAHPLVHRGLQSFLKELGVGGGGEIALLEESLLRVVLAEESVEDAGLG